MADGMKKKLIEAFALALLKQAPPDVPVEISAAAHVAAENVGVLVLGACALPFKSLVESLVVFEKKAFPAAISEAVASHFPSKC